VPTALLTTDRLTADEPAKVNATLTDTGLSFAVTSGVYYRFRFHILYSSSATSIGIKIGLTTPAFTRFGAIVRVLAGSSSNLGEHTGAITASGGSVVTPNVVTINTNYVAVIEGVLLPSANGTLMVQYASEATTAVTMKQGSSGELIEEAPAAVAVAIRRRTVLQAVQRATY